MSVLRPSHSAPSYQKVLNYWQRYLQYIQEGLALKYIILNKLLQTFPLEAVQKLPYHISAVVFIAILKLVYFIDLEPSDAEIFKSCANKIFLEEDVWESN